MIYGVGTDLTEVARVAKSAAREPFLQRVFGEEERALFARAPRRAETVAANFAAKEAFGKALGTGLSGFVWHEVQALRDENGAPYYAFSGSARQMMDEKRLTASLSLTHEGGFAAAFAVLEQEAPAAMERETPAAQGPGR